MFLCAFGVALNMWRGTGSGALMNVRLPRREVEAGLAVGQLAVANY